MNHQWYTLATILGYPEEWNDVFGFLMILHKGYKKERLGCFGGIEQPSMYIFSKSSSLEWLL
jgi:hypothetical protein